MPWDRPSPHNGSSSGQAGRVTEEMETRQGYSSPAISGFHVHVLPVLAARRPGQPPHSRRGDRKAADAGAAPAGRPQACPGEASLGREAFSWGNVLWVPCVAFVRLWLYLNPTQKLSFLFPEGSPFFTSLLVGLFETGSRTEDESGRESPG